MKKTYFFFFILTVIIKISSQAVWVEQPVNPVPPPLNSVNAVSRNVCWIAGNNGTVLYTSNGGSNWIYSNVTGFTSYSNNVIAGLDSLSALCSITTPQFTYIFRTTNKGTNWSIVYVQQAPGEIDDIKIINSNIGYALGDPVNSRWTFLRISNNGTFFDTNGIFIPQIAGDFAWLNSMYANNNNIWFGTGLGHVYYSTNSGLSWSFSIVPFQNIHAVTFGTTLGFAGGDQIAKSTTGGIIWSTVTLPGTGSCMSFANNTNRFWYARGNSIYYSSDNGSTFILHHTSPDNSNYVHLSFIFSASYNILSTITGWGITNSGSIAHYQESVGINNNGQEIPDHFELFQNYPNPFNPATFINYQLPVSSDVKLIVYDVMGRVIRTLVNEKQNAGTYNIEFDGSNLASGIYFYMINAGEFKETKKMLMIK